METRRVSLGWRLRRSEYLISFILPIFAPRIGVKNWVLPTPAGIDAQAAFSART